MFCLWGVLFHLLFGGMEISAGSLVNSSVPASWDLLQFLDGSTLHGKLRSMLNGNGVRWEHPDARQPIDFKLSNLAWIRFENPKPVAPELKPTCRFRFNNGDEILGQLVSLDLERMEFEPWFGGRLKAPRQTVQSLTFLSKGLSIVYEGPAGLEGWNGGREPKSWQYRDGGFYATGVGTLGRDFNLTNSASIEFDLAWTGSFNLIMPIYTEVTDRYDYSTSSYMFYLSPGYVTVQRVQAGGGVLPMGHAQIPSMLKRNKIHLEVRANKPEATLALLADGALVQRWKDNGGFVAKGTGVVFFSQLEGQTMKISNIKVSTWEGKFEPETTGELAAKEDLIYLMNRDKVAGALKSIADGKLSVSLAQSTIDIPLPRVTYVYFGGSNTNALTRRQGEIRAYFSGGLTVALALEKWEEQQVSGTSVNFGRMDFSPQTIRQIQFNLDQPKAASPEIPFGGEELWDFDE
jgi:hypothetical protein